MDVRPFRVKWSQQSGFHVIPSDDLIDKGVRALPFHISGDALADVDLFNFRAEPHNWPHMSAPGWRDIVKDAICHLEVYDFDGQSLYCKCDVTGIVSDLVDSVITVEDALEKLFEARCLV